MIPPQTQTSPHLYVQEPKEEPKEEPEVAQEPNEEPEWLKE